MFTKRTLLLLILLLVSLVPLHSSAYAHEVGSSYARVELVNSRYQPWAVRGTINTADPQLRASNSWSWVAVSLTGPDGGNGSYDCHTNTVASSQIEAIRIGWMKHYAWDNGSKPYMLFAWHDHNNQVQIQQGPTPPIGTAYAYSVDNRSLRWWVFNVNGLPVHSMYSGPYYTELRCVTAGGWAGTTQEAIGVSTINAVGYRTNSTGGWALECFDSPERHTVRRSPYTVVNTGFCQDQFYGNN